jgi:hypothetical protein
VLCATLRVAWLPPPAIGGFMTGAETAASLNTFVETAWRELSWPCSAGLIEGAAPAVAP